MSHRLIWGRLVLPLAAVLALSIAIFALLYARADAKGREGLESEAGKAMLQVIAAVLVSGIVLVIVRDFERRRKEWLARRDLLRADLTVGLLNLYSKAKGTRRRLRASVRVEIARVKTIDTEKYDELLERVSYIQLGLERYKAEAEAGERVGILPKLVSGDLKSMEGYLGKMVKEWEGVRPTAGANIDVTNLPRLSDFIGQSHESAFQTQFVRPYHNVALAVAEQIEKDLPRSS
jgi:hypothetical protein